MVEPVAPGEVPPDEPGSEPGHPIRARPTPWRNVILLCGKCARKMKGGYGHKGKHSLRQVLRTALAETGLRRETRIMETRCMGICPKKAVTAVDARAPDRIYEVPAGTPAADVLARFAKPPQP